MLSPILILVHPTTWATYNSLSSTLHRKFH